MAEENIEVKSPPPVDESPESKSPEGKPPEAPNFDVEAFKHSIVESIVQQLKEAGQGSDSSQKAEIAVDAQGINWDDFYSKPSEVMEKFEQRVINKVTADLTRAYNARSSWDGFWNDFYDAYPNLKEDREMVSGLLNKNYNNWIRSNITVAEAHKRLSEAAELEIERITARHAKKVPPEQPLYVVEGWPRSHENENMPSSDERVPRLSDIIRDKQKRRSSRD